MSEQDNETAYALIAAFEAIHGAWDKDEWLAIHDNCEAHCERCKKSGKCVVTFTTGDHAGTTAMCQVCADWPIGVGGKEWRWIEVAEQLAEPGCSKCTATAFYHIDPEANQS